ncbi:MAG TPA: hypothetical protein VK447_15395 [Myxococcaceae bacterium]|nr:hypothetical protein [Myxococcaceae bacterium]
MPPSVERRDRTGSAAKPKKKKTRSKSARPEKPMDAEEYMKRALEHIREFERRMEQAHQIDRASFKKPVTL